MPPFAILMLAALAGPALALPQSAREPEGLRIYSPTQFGEVAETPSHIAGSREEMNRGRNTAIGPSVQDQAADAVARAGLVCAVAEAAVIGRTRDGGSLIEIDCVEGRRHHRRSGPAQVTDCSTPPRRRSRDAVSGSLTCNLPGTGPAERSQSARTDRRSRQPVRLVRR
jgi:hypothetical protein